MPTALSTINVAKEQAATYQPLLLVEILFGDGTYLRLSTHPLNTTEGGPQYGGHDYLGRISQQDIAQFQSLSETGVDLVPSVTLTLADPDGYLYANYERASGKGFKGATLTARLVMFDPVNATFSSDSRVPFSGICEKPALDARYLTLRAVSKLQLMKALLPCVSIQKRCPWINPTTTAQRAGADSADSAFYECGETRDTTTAPPCSNTRETCTRPNRFGGVTYIPPTGSMHVREYTTGNWADVKANANEAKYGDYFPMLYGTAWIEPPVLNVIPDGNYTRGEFVVCVGRAEVLRVVVNDVELSPANGPDGGSYSYSNRDFRYNWINAGTRDGAPNPDVPYSGQGDPYGSLTALMFVVPRTVAAGDSVPRVRVLARRSSVAAYYSVASITVASNVATATLAAGVANREINDGKTVTVSGNAGVNGSFAARNGVWGPPGTFQFTTSGIANGTYAGGIVAYSANTYELSNPAWALADILTWTNFRDADIDATSLLAISAKLADRPVSLVLRQRQSAQEILRGLRQAFGIIIYCDPADGLLKFTLRETLADQQPAAISGSNYATAVSSKTYAGTTANGYVAYRFDAASILRNDLPTSLKELATASSDAPNRVSFSFADSDSTYAQSSVSVTDSDDTARMNGQEIAGSLQVQPLGISTYADAMRAARVGLAELLRGNERADTRGTRVFELQTSFRALHIKTGQLVMVNDTRMGLTNQLCRVLKVQPAQNYETTKLTLAWHSDDWYTSAYATSGAPDYGPTRKHDQLARAPFAWCPDEVAPPAGDALAAESDKTFDLWQEYVSNADGSQSVNLSVIGRTPVNVFSAVPPPAVPLQCSVSLTGGHIAGSGALWLCLCSVDSDGKYSTPSAPIRADLLTGSTNAITVTGLVWDDDASGYALFSGRDPNRMCYQSGGATKPSSVSLTALLERSWGLPDCEFDHMAVRVSRVLVPGAWTNVVDSVTASAIKVTLDMWTVDEWAGRVVSVLGQQHGASQVLANFLVASNDTNTLTLASGAPSPVDLNILPGDWLTLRCQATSATETTVTDWHLHMDTDEHAGSILRVIGGTGVGTAVRIDSNTLDTFTAKFPVQLDTSSRFIIESPSTVASSVGESIDSADPAAPMWCQVAVSNEAGACFVVKASLVDGGGNESEPITRELIVLGDGVGAPIEWEY